MLVVTFFLMAFAGDYVQGGIATLTAFAVTTWLALRAAHVTRRILRLALALIPLATLVAVVLVLVGGENTTNLVTGLLIVLLVVVAPAAILKRLLEHPVVSVNTFYGAVCVYLLIALFFATMYALISLISGSPFFVQDADPSQIDYLYFSFVTITTVGYGDLTAAGDVGRLMSNLEAVLGQLYLITVVALVVQGLGQERQQRMATLEQRDEGSRRGASDEDARVDPSPRA